MATRLELEDFLDTPGDPEPEPQVLPSEGAGVELYESGYKAGWDDAVNAEHNVRQRVGADLEKSLQDVLFTFHEARTELLAALAPLLQTIGHKILPELARDAFASQLLDIVRQRADDLKVELQVSHQNVHAVRGLFEDADEQDVSIQGVHEMGPGQALIRVGASEEMIDQEALLDEIRRSLDAVTTATPLNEEIADERDAKYAG